MARAAELFAEPPQIDKVDILAAKTSANNEARSSVA